MMNECLLINVLKSPSIIISLTIRQWEILIAQARSANMLGQIAYLIDSKGFSEQIPEKALNHLNAANTMFLRQKEQTFREVYELNKLFPQNSSEIIILKGAAYLLLDLPNHAGRNFSDIDLLTSTKDLKRVEHGLLLQGWAHSEIDDYDDHYYRQWMHEIPPLFHRHRKTIIDLHHNILPLTNKNTLDASHFKFQTKTIAKVGSVKTLIDTDLLIHTAVHLFTESEFHHGLRDLLDIKILLEYLENKQAGFTLATMIRAKELGLESYLFLAYRYAHLVFDVSLPPDADKFIFSKITLKNKILDFCFISIFKPNHATSRNWKTTVSKFILYWRGHFLRMPLYMLIPHLFHKTFLTPIYKYRAEKKKKSM